MADAELVQDTDLAKADSTDLAARPSFLPATTEGTEHITREDVKFPRLAIAQGLSDQLKKSHPKYIPGLSVGQLFNDLTGQIYGEGPLEFYIVRADPPRWVQFKPREEGGGMVDPDVPAGDPRTLWTTDPTNGGRVKPIATMFYDYVLCLWPSRELIVLSLKSSGIKHAMSLNGLIKLRNAPLWGGKYSVKVMDEPGPQGPFPNFSIKSAGWVADEQVGQYLQKLFVEFQGRTIVIDREPGDDGIETVATSTTAPSAGTTDPATGEKIPF